MWVLTRNFLQISHLELLLLHPIKPLNKYQGSLLKHYKCYSSHSTCQDDLHLTRYLISNRCWVMWDYYSFTLILITYKRNNHWKLNENVTFDHVFSGNTGIRTMWAWWIMAQRCPHTTPKALCSWERSLWVTPLWIASPLSTFLLGWVMN